jgi:hypothetical protein
MTAAKRNKSPRRVGTGRGVPLRLLTAIARKYSLSQIICWTYDLQKRQRILWWARDGGPELIASKFAEDFARAIGWPTEPGDFESSATRRLKLRINELEAALAQIVEGEPDAIELARTAGKFPREDEPENLGAWVFYPQGKLQTRRELARSGMLP